MAVHVGQVPIPSLGVVLDHDRDLHNYVLKQFGAELAESKICCFAVQGDTSRCAKPPVDLKTKVPFLPGQAKVELLF